MNGILLDMFLHCVNSFTSVVIDLCRSCTFYTISVSDELLILMQLNSFLFGAVSQMDSFLKVGFLFFFFFPAVFSSTEPSGSPQEWFCKDEDVPGFFEFDEKQPRSECGDECRQTAQTPERYESKLLCLT